MKKLMLCVSRSTINIKINSSLPTKLRKEFIIYLVNNYIPTKVKSVVIVTIIEICQSSHHSQEEILNRLQEVCV